MDPLTKRYPEAKPPSQSCGVYEQAPSRGLATSNMLVTVDMYTGLLRIGTV